MPTGDPVCPSCGSMVPHDFKSCGKKSRGRYNPVEVVEDVCMPVRSKKTTATVVNRVFYIDVSNVHPQDIPQYMGRVKEALTVTEDRATFIESAKAAGVWEDFFIPVRGVIPGKSSLWQRIKEFFVGRPDREISATRIELHKVEVTL